MSRSVIQQADQDPAGVNASLMALYRRRRKPLTTRSIIEEARKTPGSALHAELFSLDNDTLAEMQREKMAGLLLSRFTVTLRSEVGEVAVPFWATTQGPGGRVAYTPATVAVRDPNYLAEVEADVRQQMVRLQQVLQRTRLFVEVHAALSEALESA